MKFSIRDLLWLMMVIGLFFAWAMDRRNMEVKSERTQQEIERLQENNTRLQREWEIERAQLRKQNALDKQAEQGALAYPF